MRKILGAFAAVMMMTGVAAAADDEGLIADIDVDAMIITLDNGNSYKLPGEFNLEGIAEGMDIVIAFEQIDGQPTITDLQVFE